MEINHIRLSRDSIGEMAIQFLNNGFSHSCVKTFTCSISVAAAVVEVFWAAVSVMEDNCRESGGWGDPEEAVQSRVSFNDAPVICLGIHFFGGGGGGGGGGTLFGNAG